MDHGYELSVLLPGERPMTTLDRVIFCAPVSVTGAGRAHHTGDELTVISSQWTRASSCAVHIHIHRRELVSKTTTTGSTVLCYPVWCDLLLKPSGRHVGASRPRTWCSVEAPSAPSSDALAARAAHAANAPVHERAPRRSTGTD